MALDANGRPSDAALLMAMKRDMDEQISRLNDNRVYLLAMVAELTDESLALKSQLASALAEPVDAGGDAAT